MKTQHLIPILFLAALVTAAETNTPVGKASLVMKAKQIILPEFKLDGVSIPDAVRALVVAGIRSDANHKGVTYYVTWVAVDKASPKISLDLKNVTLAEAAERLAQTAGVRIIEAEDAILFDIKSGSTEPEQICAGTVRYPDGTPAADVHVAFYQKPHFLLTDYIETRTDANGRYAIIGQKDPRNNMKRSEPTNSTILVRDLSRNLASVREFLWTTTNVDLVLHPAITLSGFVKDTEGAPIAGAKVDLRFSANGLSPGRRLLVESQMLNANEAGQFSIPAMPQGLLYNIDDISAKGYGSYTAIVKADETRTNRYEFPAFVLKRTDTRLAGRVVDTTGKPIAGAIVYFTGREQPRDYVNKSEPYWSYETNTDSEGKFSFAVCDAPLQIIAEYHDPDNSGINFMGLTGGGGGGVINIQDRKTNLVIHLYRRGEMPLSPGRGGNGAVEPTFE